MSSTLFILLVLFVLLPLVVWGGLVYRAIKQRESHPESFQWVVKWLRQDQFGLFYLQALGRLLDRVGSWIGDRRQFVAVEVGQPKGWTGKWFGINPFTAESYEKCLRLAFIYPVLSFFIVWAMGSEGTLAGVNSFSLADEALKSLTVEQRWLVLLGIIGVMVLSLWLVLHFQGWKQWLALLVVSLVLALIAHYWGDGGFTEVFIIFWIMFLILFILMYVAGWLIAWLLYRSPQQAHQAIYKSAIAVAFAVAFAGAIAIAIAFAVAFTVAIAVAFAVAVAIAGAVAGAVAGAGAVAVAGAFAFAFAGAGAGAFAFAFAVIGVIIILQQWAARHSYSKLFWFIYTLAFLALGFLSLYYYQESGYMVVLLFWLILPLVNAILDWISLGFTRGLLHAVRSGNHSAKHALIWAILDLVLALIFLFLITAALIAVTALGNTISGKELIPLHKLVHDAYNKSTEVDQWWIYFMLLSTLVPTLIHFALAGGAATLWLSSRSRRALADGIENNVFKSFAAWAYLTFTPFIGFIFAPAALLVLLWFLITVNGGWLGTRLYEWALWLVVIF